MMPTMPMQYAMGMRRKASAIIAVRPQSPSITGGLHSSALDDLVEVDHARQPDRDRHEVDEGAVHDAQDVCRVAVSPDPVGLDPNLPGEEEHDRRAHPLHEALE